MSPEDEIESKLKEVLNKMLQTSILQKIGAMAAAIVKKRVKLGYGVKDQGSEKEKLMKLSEGYVEQRKKKELPSTTKASKSNLTLTGQMLDNLSATVKETGNVEIGFQDAFAHDKATWNTEKGRPFNNLSKAEIEQLKRIIEKELVSLLK